MFLVSELYVEILSVVIQCHMSTVYLAIPSVSVESDFR